MLFDTHAHYDDSWFDADREQLLASMQEHNVGLILNPGCTVETSETAIRLAETYDFLYAAVGIHPEEIKDFGIPGRLVTEEVDGREYRITAVSMGKNTTHRVNVKVPS